jgi:predicted homoserine dehydrogenase-like protein
MSYTKRLQERQAELGRPVRVGVVGAGQMGRGLIAQVMQVEGMTVAAVADIFTDKAVAALADAGAPGAIVETDADRAAALVAAGSTVVIDNGLQMPKLPVDVILEVSGAPDIAAQIAFTSLIKGKDVALMTVEADITVGLLLGQVANAGNAVYTVCRGDEPVEALLLVEYAEDLGLTVVCAGKGKNNPNRPTDVPEDVADEAAAKRMSPKMLCEFTDGTKTQLEMAALSNATGFRVEQPGMHGIECNLDDLATRLVPAADGGILNGGAPCVEYVTGDVAPGVFVVVKSESDVVTHELDYLKLGKGPYYKLTRPFHLASIEAHLSIAEAVLDRTASFQTKTWRSEVCCRAKTDLSAGTVLEGMGGHHAYGWTIDADDAREGDAIPMALITGATLKRDVPSGQVLTYADVHLDETRPLVVLRRMQDALLKAGAF